MCVVVALVSEVVQDEVTSPGVQRVVPVGSLVVSLLSRGPIEEVDSTSSWRLWFLTVRYRAKEPPGPFFYGCTVPRECIFFYCNYFQLPGCDGMLPSCGVILFSFFLIYRAKEPPGPLFSVRLDGSSRVDFFSTSNGDVLSTSGLRWNICRRAGCFLIFRAKEPPGRLYFFVRLKIPREWIFFN